SKARTAGSGVRPAKAWSMTARETPRPCASRAIAARNALKSPPHGAASAGAASSSRTRERRRRQDFPIRGSYPAKTEPVTSQHRIDESMSAFDPKRTLASPKSRNGLYGKSTADSASLQLDVEGPDEVAPLLRFVGDELAKVSGRKRERVATQVGKPRLVLPIAQPSVYLLLHLVYALH